jgi:hypothetical protein
MRSSDHGTERRRLVDSDWLVRAGERNAEANTIELGEAVAWGLELEWIGLQAVRPLYYRKEE